MFDQEQTQQEQQPLFEVGGRKYTPEDAKKKIENADMFIETLKTEKGELASKYSELEQQVAELKRKLDTSLKLEDALKTPVGQPPAQQPTAEQTPPAVDEEAILARLQSKLQQQTQEQKKAANVDAVVSQAKRKYGEAWQNKLLEQGQALGMDGNAIQLMAQTSPQALAKLFGLGEAPKGEAAPSGAPLTSGQREEAPPKSVMFGASTKDLIEQWRYSGKRVTEDYNPDVHKIAKNIR